MRVDARAGRSRDGRRRRCAIGLALVAHVRPTPAPAGRGSPCRRPCGPGTSSWVSTACTPGHAPAPRAMSIDQIVGARVRAAQRRAPQHPLGPHVRGVLELARDLRDAVGARGRSPRRRRGADRRAGPRAGSGSSCSRALVIALASVRSGDAPRRARATSGAELRPRRPSAARRRSTTGAPPTSSVLHAARRAEHERGDRVLDPGVAEPVDAATARRRRACPAPASRARPRGPGSARRRSCRARAPARAVSAAGPAGQAGEAAAPARTSCAELAGLVGGGAVDAEADRRARRRAERGTGAMPAPSRALELGQCATPVPVSPKRRTSCVVEVHAVGEPDVVAEPAELLEVLDRAHAEALAGRTPPRRCVSARWVCSRTPRRRASSAASVISSGVTENGEQGASAIAHHRARRRVVEAVDRRLGARPGSRRGPRRPVRRQPALRLAEVHRAPARDGTAARSPRPPRPRPPAGRPRPRGKT